MKMVLCVPYRYVIATMTGLGLAIHVCMRSAFSLVVTHTTRLQVASESSTAIYPHCTVFNTTRDYKSEYPEEISMQFHTVYFVGTLISFFSGAYFSSRFPADWIIGLGTVFSSALFTLIPVVFRVSAVGIFIIRFVQGLLEGMSQPAVAVLVTAWALKHDKSIIMSLAFIGLYASPAFANIFVGACLCYISWDSPMYIVGGAGVLWSLIWAKLAYQLPQDCPYLSKEESLLYATESENVKKGSKTLAKNIPWRAILTSKAVWAIWLGSFLKNFVHSTIVTLQPQFFKDVFGVRAADIGLLLSLPFFSNSIFIFVFSYTADKLVNSKCLSITAVRKLMQCCGAMTESLFFIGMVYAGTWQISFTFLTLAYTFGGMTFSGFSCNGIDLSPQFSGAVSSISMTGIVGAVASTLTASLVVGKNGTAGHWVIIFWLEAAIAACVAIFYFLFASGEKQPWDSDPLASSICVSFDSEKGDETQPLQNGHVKTPEYTKSETDLPLQNAAEDKLD